MHPHHWLFQRNCTVTAASSKMCCQTFIVHCESATLYVERSGLLNVYPFGIQSGSARSPRTLYYQDRPISSSELSFRFQPGAAATQRPVSETNAFTTGYTMSAVLHDECAIILVAKIFIKIMSYI
jgi:hypothetical protein